MEKSEIITYYQSCSSIKQTARFARISEQTVRHILIDAGLYTSPMVQKVMELYEAGNTPQEIASILHCSLSTVHAHLPYRRGCYAVGAKSKNAQHIAAWRARKKQTNQS